MIKNITILTVTLFLSACATGQPYTGMQHNCKEHCAHMKCMQGEECACGCKDGHMTGEMCPENTLMSKPDKP